jgi:peptidoglycan/xylan/chitin deacetylase (PgdA/CDA1 family)
MTEPVAALTFDDGPDPEYTPRLLDILAEYEVHATFFMLGKAAERHPKLVKMVAEAGHAIGNHSWDHPSFTAISGKQRRKQIRACEQAVAPYGQRMFRPPWGNQSLASRLDALYLGYEVVAWGVEVGDWWNEDSQRMTDLLMNRIRPGAIILLHDAIFSVPAVNAGTRPQVDREPMLRALTRFLDGLAQTYQFVTIPEMFRRGRPIRQEWFQVPRIPG